MLFRNKYSSHIEARSRKMAQQRCLLKAMSQSTPRLEDKHLYGALVAATGLGFVSERLVSRQLDSRTSKDNEIEARAVQRSNIAVTLAKLIYDTI